MSWDSTVTLLTLPALTSFINEEKIIFLVLGGDD
jgi:hypothetical protein